jgi:hypothetical protein
MPARSAHLLTGESVSPLLKRVPQAALSLTIRVRRMPEHVLGNHLKRLFRRVIGKCGAQARKLSHGAGPQLIDMIELRVTARDRGRICADLGVEIPGRRFQQALQRVTDRRRLCDVRRRGGRRCVVQAQRGGSAVNTGVAYRPRAESPMGANRTAVSMKFTSVQKTLARGAFLSVRFTCSSQRGQSRLDRSGA